MAGSAAGGKTPPASGGGAGSLSALAKGGLIIAGIAIAAASIYGISAWYNKEGRRLEKAQE